MISDPTRFQNRFLLVLALARLHRDPCGDGRYGWHSDNLIGSLAQPNNRTDDWGTFWAELRVRPLAREFHTRGTLTDRQPQDALAEMP